MQQAASNNTALSAAIRVRKERNDKEVDWWAANRAVVSRGLDQSTANDAMAQAIVTGMAAGRIIRAKQDVSAPAVRAARRLAMLVDLLAQRISAVRSTMTDARSPSVRQSTTIEIKKGLSRSPMRTARAKPGISCLSKLASHKVDVKNNPYWTRPASSQRP